MFRVRNHPGTDAEHHFGVDLHMGMPVSNVGLIEGNVCVFLFFGIQILHTAFFHKVVKTDFLVLQFLYMLFGYFGRTIFHNQKRSSCPAHIGIYNYFPGTVI
ncbi:hypothetical protein DSECCO2_478470 [anaerobic digester metagenome]